MKIPSTTAAVGWTVLVITCPLIAAGVIVLKAYRSRRAGNEDARVHRLQQKLYECQGEE